MKKKNRIWITAFLLMCLLLSGSLSEASGGICLKLQNAGKAVSGVSFNAYKIPDTADRQGIIEKNRDLSDTKLQKKYGAPILLGPSSLEGVIKADLPDGRYYVRDAGKNPAFYAVILDVPQEKSVTEVYPKAYSQGSFRLQKVSDTGEHLAGAEFSLYRKCQGEKLPVPILNGSYDRNAGSLEAVLKTDASGKLEIKNLPCGEYFLKETRAPKGYILSDEEMVFDIEKDKVLERVFENSKEHTGEITFLKVDSETEDPLKGAIFLVRENKGGVMQPVKRDGKEYLLTSNERGLFKAEHLPYGVYDLVEMRAPKGYRKLLGNVRFEISKDSKGKVIVVQNDKDKPGRLRPRLPNTGTVTVFLTLAAGLVLLMIGRRLLRDEGKK